MNDHNWPFCFFEAQAIHNPTQYEATTSFQFCLFQAVSCLLIFRSFEAIITAEQRLTYVAYYTMTI